MKKQLKRGQMKNKTVLMPEAFKKVWGGNSGQRTSGEGGQQTIAGGDDLGTLP